MRSASFRTNTPEGGSLRLKGAKDGGIKKKKKSKSRDKALSKSEDPEGERAVPTTTEGSESGGGGKGKEPEGSREPDGNNDDDDDDDGIEKGDYYAGKTEAERRFEERKRKRVGPSLCGVVGCGG